MARNEVRQLSPAERAMFFNQATRQHVISLPSRQLNQNSTIEFELPKVRLTSKIMLQIEGTVTIGGTGSATLNQYRAARFIRNLRLSINNGFNPFQISGRGLFLYNKLLNSGIGESVDEQNSLGVVRGAANAFSLFLEIPISLNSRDAIGLINTANQQTSVTLVIDSDTLLSLFTSAETGLSSDIRVTPHVESFSIPQDIQAIPDLSILKLVHEFSQVIPSAGDVTFDLQTGLTYRKFIAIYEDNAGVGMPAANLSPFNLVLNQADFPYIVTPQVMRWKNHRAYSHVFPAGVYIFDFTGEATPNYGGSRDYVDTERLTEFWLRTASTVAGRVTIITETLARLGGEMK